MNTYIIYHTDETLDGNKNLIADVCLLAKENPADIVIKHLYRNIKAAFVESSEGGVALIGALGYLVSLNQVQSNDQEKEETKA